MKEEELVEKFISLCEDLGGKVETLYGGEDYVCKLPKSIKIDMIAYNRKTRKVTIQVGKKKYELEGIDGVTGKIFTEKSAKWIGFDMGFYAESYDAEASIFDIPANYLRLSYRKLTRRRALAIYDKA